MDFNTFLENFRGIFDEDETDVSSITESSEFREINGWSSLISLSLIAMVDEEYEVVLKGDDVRKASTVKDLFEIVKERV